MSKCWGVTPQPGWKCIDCWQCRWPPGGIKSCSQSQVNGLAKYITTCKAAGTPGRPMRDTKEECEKACGLAPKGVACWHCDISVADKKAGKNGKCVEIHPTDGNGNPLKKCPNWINVFDSLVKCQKACTSIGPVTPTVNCWAKGSVCDCRYGTAMGPDGPLQSCKSSDGNYDTQGECQQACAPKKKKDWKWLWIGLGIGGGLLLLIIIIVIVYLATRHKKKPPVYYH